MALITLDCAPSRPSRLMPIMDIRGVSDGIIPANCTGNQCGKATNRSSTAFLLLEGKDGISFFSPQNLRAKERNAIVPLFQKNEPKHGRLR